MLKLLACLLVFGFAMHAEAKPVRGVGDVERVVRKCTDQWLVRQGYPAERTYEYVRHPMTNLGGPQLLFFRRFMQKCITANHFIVGDTSKVGVVQSGTPLWDLMIQFDGITE